MLETPRQYARRVLGYLEGRHPLSVLAATPRRIGKLVAGCSRARLAKRPAPDTWSVTEILAHLADSEIVYGYRIRIILDTNGSILQNTDQDAWARFSNYGSHDPNLSLEALRVGRERTLRLLRALPPAGWKRFGVHNERGRESVERIVRLLAGHDLNHLRQIEARLPKSS